jgi:hypothetical protein
MRLTRGCQTDDVVGESIAEVRSVHRATREAMKLIVSAGWRGGDEGGGAAVISQRGWWPTVAGDSRGTLQLMGGEGHVTRDRNERKDGCGGSSPKERVDGVALVKSNEAVVVSGAGGG